MTTILQRRSATMRAWIPAVGGIAAIALAVAGCGGSSGGRHASAYGAPTQTTGAASAPPSGAPAAVANGSAAASIALADSNLGKILVDSNGRTLYLFQAHKETSSTCHGACASAWPPLITNCKPIAGPGLSASKLGTTKRSDGTTEVTYNGHPLYAFVGDRTPGQATGEGNQGFGAEWDVLSAAGNKIETSSWTRCPFRSVLARLPRPFIAWIAPHSALGVQSAFRPVHGVATQNCW
jgi:predicted lipoprotein with Yx(FWY)xxD motif